ncbi:pentapeptide repeat-containing protein [Catellatospora sichuanensis]|uniref:pentapeptide repeat-containing protein n=1 Tax=Catellatospora sichuanensis TaxID=1969805 RepID=UPI001C91828B|nr:pentapeptide repeat-containing protein [Catellatospora sichuanensis]
MAPPYPFNSDIKLHELTPEQARLAQQIEIEWPGEQRATAPAERAAAEAAIAGLYQIVGAKVPRFVWVDSPGGARYVFGDWIGSMGSAIVPRLADDDASARGHWLLRRLGGHCMVDPGGLGNRYRDPPSSSNRFRRRWDERLGLWAELLRSCGGWWPWERVCVISERPVEIHAEPWPRRGDGAVRLHRADGAAMTYRDGWSLYALHGRWVPEDIVTGARTGTPEALTSATDVAALIADSGSEAMADIVGRLRGADLRGVVFPTGTDLQGADLAGADLRFADLSDAGGVGCVGAELAGANLAGADLRQADLGPVVDLRRANLSGADLSGQSLTGAPEVGISTLAGAMLHGADLSGVALVADLGGATWNTATRWPAYAASRIRELSDQMADGTFRVSGERQIVSQHTIRR